MSDRANLTFWHFRQSTVSSREAPLWLLDSPSATFERTGEFDVERFARARKKRYPSVRSRGLPSYRYTRNSLEALRELPQALGRSASGRGIEYERTC
jgi:hypothetical protein